MSNMLLETNVRTHQGRERLSRLLGSGFTILGLNRNPAAGLQPGDRDFWSDLDTTFVHMVDPDQPLPADSPPARGAVDVDGRFTRWCRAQNAEWIVVRPDRYVFGVYRSADAAWAAADLRAALAGSPPPPRRSAARQSAIWMAAAALSLGILLILWLRSNHRE